jgi:hypothetical protein
MSKLTITLLVCILASAPEDRFSNFRCSSNFLRADEEDLCGPPRLRPSRVTFLRCAPLLLQQYLQLAGTCFRRPVYFRRPLPILENKGGREGEQDKLFQTLDVWHCQSFDIETASFRFFWLLPFRGLGGGGSRRKFVARLFIAM